MEGGGGGGSGRWKLTVSDQMSVIDTSILRDFMRVREDDDHCQDSMRGLTLGAILGCEKRPATIPVSRTLLDIMRDEEPGSPCTGLAGENNKKNWKSFKDRIRLRRASTTWSASSSTHISLDDIRIQTSHPLPSPSVTANSVHILSTTTPAASAESILALNQPEIVPDNRGNIVTEYDAAAATEPVVTRLAAALAAERELQRPGRESEGDGLNSAAVAEEGREASAASTEAAAEVAPVRMSLMELLEETDRQAGSPLLGAGDKEEEVEEEEGGEYVCAVCMVRHKGAAFIPCGHTFCRLCSRELWVSRGNCPLCNGFILEILDIF